MIYTITFNPSIDYFVCVNNFKIGQLNRTSEESFIPGGKGINVSAVLTNLGAENTALGFVGGFTGKELVKQLNLKNICNDMIFLENQNTRINVKITNENETEINADGVYVTKKDVDAMVCKMKNVSAGDFIVISGGISKKVDINLYNYLIERIKPMCNNIVVDCSGVLLKNALKCRPFLVKPNLYELEQFAQSELYNISDIKSTMLKMQNMGARNILLSQGKNKALFLDEKGDFYEKEPLKGEVINTVGCGDSMVAGFVFEYLQTKDIVKAFEFSVIVSSASAFKTGLACAEDILNMGVHL